MKITQRKISNIVLLELTLFEYLLLSFIYLDFNAFNWGFWGRIILTITFIINLSVSDTYAENYIIKRIKDKINENK